MPDHRRVTQEPRSEKGQAVLLAARDSVLAVLHAGRRLRDERGHLGRFIASRVLWHTGTGARMTLRARLEEGVSVRFDRSSLAATLWLDSSYGSHERRAIARLLEPGDYFVDVGANIGVLSMVGAVAVGPTGGVIALEPHPATFARLERNVADNRLHWVRCVRAAAGELPGVAGFSDLRTDDQNYVLDCDVATIAVPVEALDRIVDPERAVALLKVDVEGYEHGVLAGAPATLRRTGTVLIECSRKLSARHGFAVDQTLQLLERHGFTVLDANTLRPPLRPWRDDAPRNVIATRRPDEVRARLAAP